MDIIDWTGFLGVSLILLAYFLNLKNKLTTTSLTYILMNLFGATLACTASILMEYIPFIILEGVWTIVSVDALIKYINGR
ncbi:MAG: hypothetical protein AAFZ15_12535 [Bacteroidota bacterium]